jgi:hypothetical protein
VLHSPAIAALFRISQGNSCKPKMFTPPWIFILQDLTIVRANRLVRPENALRVTWKIDNQIDDNTFILTIDLGHVNN